MISTILLIIGLITVLKPVAQLAFSLYHHFRVLKLKADYSDGWAVVTGATDGIGFGFCQVLSEQGYNVCLISRNAEKLAKKVEELRAEFGDRVQYRTVQADFKNSHEEGFFDKIFSQLKQIKPVLLINNVGFAQIDKVEDHKLKTVYESLDVNCTPMTVLSSYMIDRFLRQGIKGGIVNISSHCWVHPFSYLSVYSATKAYVDILSRSCSKELKLRNIKTIDVLSVRAMLVQSGSVPVEKSLLVPTSRECAQDSLKYLGHCEYTTGHIKHEIVYNINELIPEFILNMISGSQSTQVYNELRHKSE